MKKIGIRSLRKIGAISMLIMLFSCEGDGIFPNTNFSYYPIDNTQQTFKREYLSGEGDIYYSDTVKFKVVGDTTVEGKTYKKVFIEYNSRYLRLYKVVRSEGMQYFKRETACQTYCDPNALKPGPEYMFLNAQLKTGDGWSISPNEYSKIDYMIDDADATVTINEVEYKNVIKVSVSYYDKYATGEYEFRNTAWHYYARGVGEIYSYYQYPQSGVYADMRWTLVPKKIK